MKKITSWILAFLTTAALFSSCNLDVDPTNAVDSGLVYESTEQADKVLNGAWKYLWDTYNSYQNPGWTCLLLTSDAMGQDVALQPGKYGYLAHYSFTSMSASDARTVGAVWALAYKTIDNTNNLITKIEGVPGEASQKSRIKAQAQALRGYLYLNLATFYAFSYETDSLAPAVPIYTEPSTRDTEGKPRSPLHAVYKQAETDLLAAFDALDGYQRGGKKHAIDQAVTAGLLARLYLQTNRWQQAQAFAHKAQQGLGWMAREEYLKGFNDCNNAEWLWGHGQTGEQNVASYSFNYKDVSSEAAGYYSFMADPYFKDLFQNDSNDIRFGLFEWDLTRFAGGLMYKKFRFRPNTTADIVLMRKAELVLIEAEAYAEQGRLADAVERLNELRAQRGAATPDLTPLGKQQLIAEILIERRKELFGEGFALSDLLRRQQAVVRKAVPANTLVPGTTHTKVQGHTVTKLPDGTDFVKNSPYYLFSIPDTEWTNNPNL